jgi:CRP-like cAMP-binding protein
MYFIAKGSCEVEVITNYDLQLGNDPDSTQKIGLLGEGAHFGEVSLIYGCRRTASVISSNYCTLASLTSKDLRKMDDVFHSLRENFKKFVIKYEDDLKMFLEFEMEKIPYWKDLSLSSK